MLQDVPRAIPILKAVRDAVPPHVPTTVSLRRGFDDSPESLDRFYEIVETAWSLGYAAVRVHARTVEQKYQGRARWPFLADMKHRYPRQTILGSGDVFTAEDRGPDAHRNRRRLRLDRPRRHRQPVGFLSTPPSFLRRSEISPTPGTEPSGSAASSSARLPR